jgi:hypothetical protein
VVIDGIYVWRFGNRSDAVFSAKCNRSETMKPDQTTS